MLMITKSRFGLDDSALELHYQRYATTTRGARIALT
jgi:hypothetical protein